MIPVCPVHLAPTYVQGNDQVVSPITSVTRSSILDTVEVGPLNLIRFCVRPVHLAPSHVQGDAIWVAQSRGDEVFDIGAVEVCPLNFICNFPVRPVHLRRATTTGGRHVQSEVAGKDHEISKITIA